MLHCKALSFLNFYVSSHLYRCGSTECNFIIDVSEHKQDSCNSTSHKSFGTSVRFKEMYFIWNDKHISDNSTSNEDGIGTCEMDFAKDHL